MNERYLKAEMVLYGDNLEDLAKYLHIARQTLARKIAAGTFRQDEMSKIKRRYNLSNEKFAQIFTGEEVETDEGERRRACT